MTRHEIKHGIVKFLTDTLDEKPETIAWIAEKIVSDYLDPILEKTGIDEKCVIDTF